jgi:hypothetical protein
MKKSRLFGVTLVLTFSSLSQSLWAVEPADLSLEPPVLIGPGPSVESAALPVAPTEPLAPPAKPVIEGVNFDDNATNTGGFVFIPPDPMGAVGPNHLVSIVNASIEWHTKAGVEENSQGIGSGASGTAVGSFFAPLAPVNPLFDPKVLYDQHADRFVVVALELQDVTRGDPTDTSRILLAVSDDSDPNGTWYFHAINSKISLGGLDRWADYPGFSVDEEAVYITSNMFAFGSGGGSYGGSLLWIVDKGLGSGGFYDGGATGVAVYDPYAAVGQPGFATTTQPAHVFGAGGIPGAGNAGTFLVAYSGLSNGVDEFLGVIKVDDPLATSGGPLFLHQFIGVGDIDNVALPMPDAPQAGTATLLETNDRRVLHAVWRADSLWVTAQVVPTSGPDSNEATAHWWEMYADGSGAIDLVQQGDVGGEDIAAGTYTFFPSIAVDGSGNMGIGFAASASSIFPSAAYTGRLSTEPAGTVQPSEILAAGQDFYVRTFGAGRNRWGDYSGIAIDPTDDMTFCAFNEYALTRGTLIGGEDGRWGTRWGCFTFLDTDDLGDADCDGAVTPIDASVILGLFVGSVQDGDLPPPCNDTTHRLALSDWELSGTLNPIDASITLGVFVGTIDPFCDTPLGVSLGLCVPAAVVQNQTAFAAARVQSDVASMVATASKARLEVGKVSAQRAAEVTVDVTTRESLEIGSSGLSLSYDASALEVISVESDLEGFTYHVDAKAGVLRSASAGLGQNVAADDALMQIIFRVKPEARRGKHAVRILSNGLLGGPVASGQMPTRIEVTAKAGFVRVR